MDQMELMNGCQTITQQEVMIINYFLFLFRSQSTKQAGSGFRICGLFEYYLWFVLQANGTILQM